jgi:hypothetical protein
MNQAALALRDRADFEANEFGAAQSAIRRHSFLTGHLDHVGDQALLNRVMDLPTI